MENKKSSNAILVVLFTLLILLFVGYLIYDKKVSKINPKETSKEPQNEKKEYDLVEAKKLIDKYYVPEIFDNGYDDNLMMYLAYKNLNSSQITEVECDEIYGDLKKEESYYYVENLGFCADKVESISYDVMNNSYKSLFGKLINKTDFKYYVIPFDYEEKSNSFVILDCNCGSVDISPHYIYGIKSAQENNNVLNINVGFYKLDLEEYDLYSSYYSNFDEYVTYTFEEVHESNFDARFFEKYSNYMDTYTFTFVKQNENYVLFEMVKQ